MARLVKRPRLTQVLAFCAEDPIERVFLEDAARRGVARFRAVEGEQGLAALCYFGANVVPSGQGCEAFAGEAAARATRMIIGEAGAVFGTLACTDPGMLPGTPDCTHRFRSTTATVAAPRGDGTGALVHELTQDARTPLAVTTSTFG